jgi:alcohol dehydrogenase class IV
LVSAASTKWPTKSVSSAASRALVLSTPQHAPQAEDLAARLGDLSIGVFTKAAMHTPVAVTLRALDVVRERQADCTVALGGGSTTGLGKAPEETTSQLAGWFTAAI